MVIRQALRVVRSNPWYSFTVTSVVALCVSLATTVFALVDGVLFRSLPFVAPDELYIATGPSGLSSADVEEWSATLPDIGIAAYQSTFFEIGSTLDERPQRLLAARISPAFLELLGQKPILGGFQPEHFSFSAGRTPVLISFRLWQRQFGEQASVVGQRLDLVGAVDQTRSPLSRLDIVGVLPSHFVFPVIGGIPDVVLPMTPRPDQLADRNRGAAGVLLRIPKPHSVTGIKDRIEAVAARQGFQGADTGRGGETGRLIALTGVPTLLGAATGRGFRDAFLVAMILVVLACVNIGALGLARSSQRARDIAVYGALGASRWTIAQIVLAELLPLTVAGAAIGLILAPGLIGTVVALMNPVTPLMSVPRVDLRVASFALLASFVVAAGSVALQLRRLPSQFVTLRSGVGITSHSGRWQSALVTAQVALTTVMVLAGTLFVGSVWWAWRQDPGFTPGGAVIVELTTGRGTADRQRALFDEVVAKIGSIPGIRYGLVQGDFLRPRSRSVAPVVRPPSALPGREQLLAVGEEFFGVLDISPISGRLPSRDEWAAKSPVAVVSERVARNFWPGRDAVGQSLTERGANPLIRTVIGVVPDARFNGIDIASVGQIYWARPDFAPVVIARTSASADATLGAIVHAVRAVGGPVGVVRATSLSMALGESMRDRTFAAWLHGGFALSALTIATVGILGLVGMVTARRTKEMGLRCALGASKTSIIWLVLRDQAVSLFVGLVLGCVAAWWAVRYISPSMYQFTPYDLRLWAVAILVVSCAAFFAALVPALRVARIDPLIALRAE